MLLLQACAKIYERLQADEHIALPHRHIGGRKSAAMRGNVVLTLCLFVDLAEHRLQKTPMADVTKEFLEMVEEIGQKMTKIK